MDRKTQIRRYFEGKLSRQEAQEFLNWFNSEEHEHEVHAEIDKLWYSSEIQSSEWNGSNVFKLIQQRKNNERSLNIQKPEEKRKFSNPSLFKIAATVALLIASTLIYFNIKTQEESQEEIVYEEIVKSNPPGQKSRVYLPDGSVVNLNSGSQLKYTEGFHNGRVVYLEGEAFFDVKKDSLRPFTVVSGRLSTTALGTSFNINAFGEDEEVVLVTGKVSVRDENTRIELLLDPGEKVHVNAQGKSFTKEEADILAHTYWKDGILYFNKVKMAEVIGILERWYGVKIIVTGKVPGDRCTGLFKKNEYLTNVLKILSHSVAFDYQLNDKEVKLMFN
tara:strand:- start:2465 stop:3463 length:999 start_codon:yes stop_codon:yes gene_type:complete